jgi:hypothetical protein
MMFLSSCDLVCRSYPYINRIFFYSLPSSPPSSAPSSAASSAPYSSAASAALPDGSDAAGLHARHVAALKASLARALVDFYPLAGRFANDGDPSPAAAGRLCVLLNDAGAEFVEARVDGLPYRALKDASFQHSELFWKLCRRTHLLRSDYLDQPILSVQVINSSRSPLAPPSIARS